MDPTFRSFNDMIEYNVEWLNNEFEHNIISDSIGYADDGVYDKEPVRDFKEDIIIINKLGFLTTNSQFGVINKKVMERAYICGYVKTSTAEKLCIINATLGKFFQYVPLKKSLYFDDDQISYYVAIPVTFELPSMKAHTRVGFEHRISDEMEDALNNDSEFYTDFIEEYSEFFIIDPVCGIPFNTENGILNALLKYA